MTAALVVGGYLLVGLIVGVVTVRHFGPSEEDPAFFDGLALIGATIFWPLLVVVALVSGLGRLVMVGLR